MRGPGKLSIKSKREREREYNHKKFEENNYVIEVSCRLCGTTTRGKKYREAEYKRQGGTTCKECLRKQSANILQKYHAKFTPEERSAHGRFAQSRAKKENQALATVKQWNRYRADPVRYAELCQAKSETMKKVWKGYSNEQKEFILTSLVKANKGARSKLSDIFKSKLIENHLYDGFSSEECFHGFFPDEINHQLRIIIEVFGDTYHCNPKFYKNKNEYEPAIQRTVKEQWLRDKRRLACFYSHGYTVVIVWENELMNVRGLKRVFKRIGHEIEKKKATCKLPQKI